MTMTSARFWNHPLLPIGVVLMVIGMGNWWVSRDKIAEYSQRLAASRTLAVGDLSDFSHLDLRTNRSLLGRLHRLPAEPGMPGAKRDFYVLVSNGGRLIAMLGFALLAVGAVRLAGDSEPDQVGAGE